MTRPQIAALSSQVQTLASDLKKKVWYTDVPTLIALFALVFSFGTTAFSYLRTQQQDIHDRRVELRGVLQRLLELPKDLYTFNKRAISDPASSSTSATITKEIAILAQEADDIIRRLPRDQIVAADYIAIASSHSLAANYALAAQDYTSSLLLPHSAEDEIEVLNALGFIKISIGKYSEARSHFKSAAEIFSRYPTADEYSRNSGTITTELNWAVAESNAGNPQEATKHFAKADAVIEKLSQPQMQEYFRVQSAYAKKLISQDQATVPASTSPPIPTSSPPIKTSNTPGKK